MPEAIATTKRKFYKALDAFNAGSQTSLTPSTSSSAPNTKRPATAAAAFDEARQRAAKRLRHSTSTSSLPYASLTAPSAAHKEDPKPQPPPNFSPWSHETFLARLKTFSSVSLWHPKPEAISEVQWAKRGWICVDVNTVACKGGCEKRVVVSLALAKRTSEDREDGGEDHSEDDADDESEFERAIAERYEAMIVDGHAANCLWRKAGCKDDIYRLQVIRPAVWQPELRNRCQSLLAIDDAIQDVHVKPVENDGSTSYNPEKLLKDLPAGLLGEQIQETPPAVYSKALSIALHGWRGSKESSSQLLHCDACFQRIGLWMYQPGYKSAYTDSDEEGDSGIATIDLVELHREHCPWRNPTTQKASGSLAGLNACQILLRVVATYAREQRRKSDEPNALENDNVDKQHAAEQATEIYPTPSREEIARQDKERESRLRKLKSMFSIKRRNTKSAPKATPN